MTTETALKRAVKMYMRLNSWYIFHVLQGLGCHKGISDFIAIKKGKVLFIEVKAPGGKLSKNQKQFKQEITEAGGHYIVAFDIYDIENYILDHFGEKSLLL